MKWLQNTVITAGLLLAAVCVVRGHDLPNVAPENQAWYQNAETNVEARATFPSPWAKCCSHAELIKTQFRVNKTDNGDDWYYLRDGKWLPIPRVIVHPYDEHAPDGQPTLFEYMGTLTCFFIGAEGG